MMKIALELEILLTLFVVKIVWPGVHGQLKDTMNKEILILIE